MKFSKIFQATIATLVFVSVGLPAFALKYKHANASAYNNTDTFIAFNVASGTAGLYISAWENFDAVSDGTGYRLKIRGTNNCLNAQTNLAIGTTLFSYTCTPGDAGQVFSPTPSVGQIKFEALNGSRCIEPQFGSGITGYPNGLKLTVQSCSNSGNQTFIEQQS